MPRAKSFSTSDLETLFNMARKCGVRKLAYRGVEVEFEPTFKMPNLPDDFEDDPAYKKERLQSALDDVLKQKKEDDDVLFHSV